MTLKIGVISQKGGVGKSTLSRMIAREYANSGWEVKIADMDSSQATSYNWHRRRIENQLEPSVAVEMFSNVGRVNRIENNYDLIVFDGAPHSSRTTLQIAQESTLIIIPTGNALDDLEPTIRLAHELVQNGVSGDKIAMALCKVGDSPVENREAADYLRSGGYHLLDGSLPERTVYRRASDMGKTATETTHTSTNERAAELMQSIIHRIKTLTQEVA